MKSTLLNNLPIKIGRSSFYALCLFVISQRTCSLKIQDSEVRPLYQTSFSKLLKEVWYDGLKGFFFFPLYFVLILIGKDWINYSTFSYRTKYYWTFVTFSESFKILSAKVITWWRYCLRQVNILPRLLFFCLDNNFIITSFLLSTFQLMLFLLGQIIVSVFFLFNKARNWANWDSISLILVFLPFFDRFGRTRDRHAQKGGSRGAYDKIGNGLE